jgi:glucose-1-phosphate thymidylyltransferase
MVNQNQVIGIIPAGGQGMRLNPLPCSKELYPVGFQRMENGSLRPKPVCIYLLEKMRLAGISKVYIILRSGKWDIPAYLGNGTDLNIHLAYLIMGLPFGVPYTLDQAFPFIQDRIIAFGFPDIIFQPEDAFRRLLTKQAETDADIVLALFPVDQPEKWDMVKLDGNGRIRRILIKPMRTKLRYTWIISVWTPVFSNFMHQYLIELQETGGPMRQELFMSDVVQQAIKNGLKVEGVLLSDGSCLDIGTPEDLVKAVRDLSETRVPETRNEKRRTRDEKP